MQQTEASPAAVNTPPAPPAPKVFRVIATPVPAYRTKTVGGEAWRKNRERWNVTTEGGEALIKATTNPLIQAARVLVCGGRIEAHDLITFRFAGKARDVLPPMPAGPLAEQGIWLKLQTARNTLKAQAEAQPDDATSTTSTTSN